MKRPVVRLTRDGFRTLANHILDPNVERMLGADTYKYILEQMITFGIVVQEQLLGPQQAGLFEGVQSNEKEEPPIQQLF